MLTAPVVQKFLRQFEPLKEVMVDPQSDFVFAPHLVRVHGLVTLYGEHHAFETDLDLNEFGSAEDLFKLAKQLMKSFAAASQATRSFSV